jgi:hypothetical protein
MTIEQFLQEHARGCYIRNMQLSADRRVLQVELHSGLIFTIEAVHGTDDIDELIVKFDNEELQ